MATSPLPPSGPIGRREGSVIQSVRNIAALEGAERRSTLIAWARSPSWSAPLMLCDDWLGALAREAYQALTGAAAKETPAKRWERAGWAKGRTSIVRLLGIPEDRAFHATYPFRSVEEDDRPWIGGALGCPPCLDQSADDLFPHLSITDVILWNPRTGEARLAGDTRGHTTVIAPPALDDAVTVYSDVGAFFRDWAAQRARTANMAPVHPDFDLPGLLVVGSIDKACLAHLGPRRLIAGPGLTRKALQQAVVRSANLPTVEEGALSG